MRSASRVPSGVGAKGGHHGRAGSEQSPSTTPRAIHRHQPRHHGTQIDHPDRWQQPPNRVDEPIGQPHHRPHPAAVGRDAEPGGDDPDQDRRHQQAKQARPGHRSPYPGSRVGQGGQADAIPTSQWTRLTRRVPPTITPPEQPERGVLGPPPSRMTRRSSGRSTGSLIRRTKRGQAPNGPMLAAAHGPVGERHDRRVGQGCHDDVAHHADRAPRRSPAGGQGPRSPTWIGRWAPELRCT